MKFDHAMWARVVPLLDSALELPRDARMSWLATVDANDQVRAALRRLLADRERIEHEGFLEGAPMLPGDQDRDAETDALRPGGRVGLYRLVRELGQGGMSVVWLAERDDSHLKRRVALKIPHAGPGQAASSTSWPRWSTGTSRGCTTWASRHRGCRSWFWNTWKVKRSPRTATHAGFRSCSGWRFSCRCLQARRACSSASLTMQKSSFRPRSAA